MKSLYNFIIESTKWVSSSTADDYSYDNDRNKPTSKENKTKTITVSDITGKEKKDVAIWILDSGRMGYEPYNEYKGKILNKLIDKYQGDHKVLAVYDETFENRQLKEISSIKDLDPQGMHPKFKDILRMINSGGDLWSKDYNIFITDEDMFTLTSEDLTNKINEATKRTKLSFYVICEKENFIINNRYYKLAEEGKIEINFVQAY